MHGWLGLTMPPNVYPLLEPNPIIVPGDLGQALVYTQFAPSAMIKMIYTTFMQDRNYFLSYKKINQAFFQMLDDLVPNQFKVSNTPMLTGWNGTMSIQVVLAQMEDLYGKPLAAALFANNALFKIPFHSTEPPPKLLFYRIEQCQEIMTLGKLPYTM